MLPDIRWELVLVAVGYAAIVVGGLVAVRIVHTRRGPTNG